MGVLPLRRRRRRRLLTALTFLLFASISASASASASGLVVSVSPSASGPPRHRVKSASTQSLVVPDGKAGGAERVLSEIRRRLGGPGSSPPTCRSKCGRCTPCKAVHVPIQPGVSIPLEYYPEAWRCKCGNKLFMP